MASKSVRLGKFYFVWNLTQPQGWGGEPVNKYYYWIPRFSRYPDGGFAVDFLDIQFGYMS